MPDKRITELTAITTPATTDLLAVVADPAGVPVTKKATIANVLLSGGAVITAPAASQLITAGAATVIPLTIRGAASQSADLFVIEGSAGVDMFAVAATGGVTIPGAAGYDPYRLVVVGVAGAGANGQYPFLVIHANDTAPGAIFRSDHASFAGHATQIAVTRAASTAFEYLACWSANYADYEYRLRGDGNAFCDGSWSGGGADYAEYFESTTGAAIPVGTTVVLDGGLARAATRADRPMDILGVVRPVGASASVGNSGWNKWQGKHLRDDFGAYVMEDHEVWEWEDEEDAEDDDPETGRRKRRSVTRSHASDRIPDDVSRPDRGDVRITVQQRRRIDPRWDPDRAYVSREQRPEWVIVGLLGQVPVRNGQPVGDRWVRMRDVSDDVSMWLIR